MPRPILIVVIGYIIGIIWGLYFKFSIAFFYIFMTTIYLIIKKLRPKAKIPSKKLKLFSIKRYLRYIKLILNSKVINTIIIFSIISNSIILVKENQRQKLQEYYQKIENIQTKGIIVSKAKENEYNYQYKFKVTFQKEKNIYFYININKKMIKDPLKIGDMLQIEGTFLIPNTRTNYGGFDYNQYLKQENIIGTIKIKTLKVISTNQENPVILFFSNLSNNLKNKVKNVMQEDVYPLVIGILLNDMSNISEDTKENFKNSNLSHILAVSGTHMTYLMIGMAIIFNKNLGKRKTYIISIIIIIFYTLLVGFSPSVYRAAIMGIMFLFSKILYKKNDIWTSMSLSLLIILIYNPYLISNLGLQFSYGGTIGILLFCKTIDSFFEKNIYNSKRYKYNQRKIELFILKKVLQIVSVTLSANLVIIPIMLYHLNTLNIYFIISNILVNIIITPLMIISFIFLFTLFINLKIAKIIAIFVSLGIKILIMISKIGEIPFSKIYIATPKLFNITIYFILIFLINIYYSKVIVEKQTITAKRFKNIFYYIKYRMGKFKREKRILIKKIIVFTIIFSIISLLFLKPKCSNLKIHFIDVGQGDSCFIITPQNKTILIDGGGSTSKNYDIGEKVLLPYILDRGYTKIDLVIISHFDQDHIGGLYYILNEIKVKEVCIAKQYENTENYEKFLKIAKAKNIKINVLKMGNIIKIKKNVKFKILFPEEKLIAENSENNNALVMQLIYKDFKMLFTGDIEKIAENKIVKLYENTNILQSDILKVAHHGSKTSTTEEILSLVKPKIALIGVGENNLFGHPSKEVIDRLKSKNIKIYTTSQCGEIVITINNNFKSISSKMYKFVKTVNNTKK